jgi:preprotein translocase subunit SecG|tara:strand:- start:5070 stop:5444 length:375 start_codon:yes stop_codon:yes gene_type:complete
MEQLILVGHVVFAIVIIGLIMIQQGKGADMGASFGSGSSQTVFGAGGGGNLLTRLTAVLATLFFATSFGLAIVAKDKASNMVEVDYIPEVIQSAPAMTIESELDAMEAEIPRAPTAPTFSDIPE